MENESQGGNVRCLSLMLRCLSQLYEEMVYCVDVVDEQCVADGPALCVCNYC